ncbi:uncharacterized protein LOC117648189 [Thrips palmi]|uniref:Uncharacterized protein LOC117648189 n=1 Tax=Thrips palmi TaxID=161013 RepID=A0A6P8ZQT6_THRPL|nr:uncharacterized protein LOC117648189 [Thrips palmi]
MPCVMAAFYEAVADRIEREPCSRRWLALQSAVLQASVKMQETVFPVLPGLLVMVFVMPMCCTLEIMGRGLSASPFALLTAPHIFAMFIPLCFAGDMLAESCEAVGDAAYNGAWDEETPSQRRVRISVMQASRVKAGIRGIGIGHLDRPACRNALKSWYSFVQFFARLGDLQEAQKD